MLAMARLGILLVSIFVLTDQGMATPPVPYDGESGRSAISAGQIFTPPQPEVPDDPPASPEALSGQTSSAAASVTFGAFTSVQVNVDGAGNNIVGDAANEPSMAIHPLNPNQIAIGWRQFDSIASNFREGGFGYSTNGGQTWTFGGVLEQGVFRSDPVLATDGFGNFYYSSLTQTNQGIFEVRVFKSTDGGASWPTSAYAYGGDKQWLVADRRTAGIGAGHLYQNWHVTASCCGPVNFTRSIDAGSSFQPPLTLPYPDVFFGTSDTDAAGTLYLGGIASYANGFAVMRSDDARNPAVTPTFTSTLVNLGGYLAGSGNLGPNPAGLVGQVWLVAHPTKMGHVYMLGSIFPFTFDDPSDIMFARSVDGGMTWSDPVRVNDDVAGNWQWFGALAVAPNGRIDVTWNDTRGSGEGNVSAVFYAYSLDEGQTWSVNNQVSPEFNSHLGWPNQNKIGDYTHLISDDGGTNLAYAATFNGEQDVYFLRIRQDCDGNGIDDDCDIDCRPTGSRCDVAGCGQAQDCNKNNIPDSCEPSQDCNQNGQRDTCEIGNNPALDCNSNRRIDYCENGNDCNFNKNYDVCDLFAHGDCNHNGVPDDCDVAALSTDRNHDNVPDECQGSCCLCGPCEEMDEIECFMYGGIFAGPDILCGEAGSCTSPLFDHDFCEQAYKIPSAPSFTTDFDNRCALSDQPFFVNCPTSTYLGADLWYTYKAPCTGTVEFSTCDTTNYDAMIALYGGGSSACSCPGPSAGAIACEDDSCGFQGGPPVLSRSVISGRCYTIRVGGWQASIGTGDLSISYLTACNPTDLNGSGITDLRDFAVFQNCFGPLRAGCSASDFDHDGAITIDDYRALHAMMGQ